MIRVRVKNSAKLRKLLRTLAAPNVILLKISEVAQEETLNLISEGFKKGQDPYGKPWEAPSNLQITGALRRYAKGRANAKEFAIHSTDGKAIWHHDPQPRPKWGGKALPTRLQVPTRSNGGLPPPWVSRVKEAAEEAIEAIVGSK